MAAGKTFLIALFFALALAVLSGCARRNEMAPELEKAAAAEGTSSQKAQTSNE